VVLAESWLTRAASFQLLLLEQSQEPLTAKYAEKSREGRGGKLNPTKSRLLQQLLSRAWRRTELRATAAQSDARRWGLYCQGNRGRPSATAWTTSAMLGVARALFPMKFADKYEILEMVTSGRVSTFLARERTTQEPVVVYTFECVGTGAGDLSTASIIARFCALAPNPPGMIVKAGFDAPSSSAFLTTRMPESEALKAWVGAYQSFAKPGTTPARPAAGGAPTGDETAELSASEVRAVLARSGTPAKQPPIENLSEDLESSDLGGGTAAFSLSPPTPASPQSAGEFTRLFNEVNAFQPTPGSRAPAGPVASNPVSSIPAMPKPSDSTEAMFGELLGGSPLGGKPAPPAAPPAPVEPPPGSFTREFLGLAADKTPTPEVVPRTPTAAPKFSPPAEKEPGAFTREFLAVSQDVFKTAEKPSFTPAQKTAPSPPTSFDSIFGGSATESSAPGGEQKAGEFTSFFRDPFESPGAPAKPIDIPQLDRAAPAKPPVGDFTRMFGRGDLGREEPAPLPALEPERSRAPAESFTQMFGEVPAAKRSQESQLGSATLGTNPNLRPSFLESSGVQDAPPPRAATPATPPEPFFSDPSTSFSSAFSSPPPVAPAANQTFMGRPGSTTDVFRIPGGDAPPVDQMPSGPSEFTVFLSRSQLNESLAAAGAAPASAVPPPPAPQPGPFQFAPPPPPAPPAIKYPPAPAVPAAPPMAAPAAAPKLASFWPLIVVLTVLFAIGALMVMYFALKH
jgi:hypothetical protein